MFVHFTPFSFLFLLFYFLFLFIVLYCPDFYSYWVLIECSSLLFIGLSYSFLSYGFSNLILYFIIQALSSVNIFVFYSLSYDSLLLFFLFLKLAVFPFFGWYLLVVSKLTNSLFFFISTLQKFPSVLLFCLFVTNYNVSFLLSFLLCTVFVCSLFMFSSFRFRTLLAFSSVGGNSWFIISSMVRLEFFYTFFIFYTFNFLVVLYLLGTRFKLSSSIKYSYYLLFFCCIISLAGFPPFPPFFLKLYMLFYLCWSSIFRFSLTLLFLLSLVYMLSSYIRFSLSYFINIFSSSINFIL